MPAVALKASTAPVLSPSITGKVAAAQPCPADATGSAITIATSPRPQLRLVSSSPAAEVEAVHGHGGPASCSCRECTMARHPAAMPRFSVVR